MENNAQWIMIAAVLGTLATFTHHYKTGLVCFVAVFALCMLPPSGLPVGPTDAAALWFVGLPMILTATLPLWGPVLIVVGCFVVAGWLFPKKAG
jgi:hypothetical protein